MQQKTLKLLTFLVLLYNEDIIYIDTHTLQAYPQSISGPHWNTAATNPTKNGKQIIATKKVFQPKLFMTWKNPCFLMCPSVLNIKSISPGTSLEPIPTG